MSDLVKQHGVTLLEGDAETYQALKKQQSSDAARYTREVHVRALRQQAEAAWRSKDYQSLLKLYGEMQGDLSPLESKKCEYVKKRLLSIPSRAPNGK